MGFDSYCDSYLKIAEETLFQKHIDYCGENEYRFISFSNEKYEKLNIRESLIGIIVSKDLINEYSLERLKKYAEEYKVELIFIEWKENGLNISTKTQNDKLVDDIESMMKK
jgi:serine kinase of HPr protein (carbohydrate metabolism regulator)